MSEQQKSGGGFPMAFTAGLVVGILVGAFAAVVIPPFLGGPGEIKHQTTPSTTNRAPREERPPTSPPVLPPPVQTPTQPTPTQPAPAQPTTPPAAAPGTPPATEPKPATQPATQPR